jgi:hypothetical protein
MDEWWQHQDLYPEKKNNSDRWPPDPYLIYGEYGVELDNYDIKLVSPKSPITGLQFTHDIELLPDKQVRFSIRAKNISTDTLFWGIWTNMQLPGNSICYVPMAEADTLWFKKNRTADQDTIPYQMESGYFSFRPEDVGADKSSFMTKACIFPAEPWMAAFNKNQMILIECPRLPRERIHPSQAQIEIFNLLTPGRPDDLLELETHSPYEKLAPGQSTETTLMWRLLAYSGSSDRHDQISYLKSMDWK